MKKSLLLIVLAGLWVSASAQLTRNERNNLLGFHEGYYFSLGVGPVFGSINDEVSGADNYVKKFSGTGTLLDIKLGVVMVDNFIVHADYISSALAGPTIKRTDEPTINSSNNTAVGESMIGVGLTRYFMPSNMFISGTVGFGNYKFKDTAGTTSKFYTERGLAFQVKLGKELLLTPELGIGVAVTYGRTNVNRRLNYGNSEHITSNRFGIALNATINKVR